MKENILGTGRGAAPVIFFYQLLEFSLGAVTFAVRKNIKGYKCLQYSN